MRCQGCATPQPTSSSFSLTDVTTSSLNDQRFALVAMQAGTAFIEVTDPYHPVVVGKLPTVAGLNAQGTFWRDIKTIGHHALVVSEEQEHGLQIFDLTLLLNKAAGTVFGSWRHGGFANAHNVFVHEDTGFAYVVGSSECGGGMYVLDMANPTAPGFAGCYTQDGYVHGESRPRICTSW